MNPGLYFGGVLVLLLEFTNVFAACTFKKLVFRGVSYKKGGTGGIGDLWSSDSTRNENNADARVTGYGEHYKSSEVDKWDTSTFNKVRLEIIKSGVEQMYFEFDATGTNKFTWFTKTQLIESSIDITDELTVHDHTLLSRFITFQMYKLYPGCPNPELLFFADVRLLRIQFCYARYYSVQEASIQFVPGGTTIRHSNFVDADEIAIYFIRDCAVSNKDTEEPEDPEEPDTTLEYILVPVVTVVICLVLICLIIGVLLWFCKSKKKSNQMKNVISLAGHPGEEKKVFSKAETSGNTYVDTNEERTERKKRRKKKKKRRQRQSENVIDITAGSRSETNQMKTEGKETEEIKQKRKKSLDDKNETKPAIEKEFTIEANVRCEETIITSTTFFHRSTTEVTPLPHNLESDEIIVIETSDVDVDAGEIPGGDEAIKRKMESANTEPPPTISEVTEKRRKRKRKRRKVTPESPNGAFASVNEEEDDTKSKKK